MIEVDLHSHTHFSNCGLHSCLEMLEAARAKGMKGLAITDHGLSLGGRLNSIFFERLKDPVPGIRHRPCTGDHRPGSGKEGWTCPASAIATSSST